VVLIGFSVDYIIHYSAEYMHSAEKTRDLKMKQALRQMGVSIFGGFLTTLGSGIFLLTCEIKFFFKFGETISLSVTYAFLIATLTYSALMKAVGPTGNFGNIFCCIQKKKADDDDDKGV
jgi:predicted RND superfamily exporter protein